MINIFLVVQIIISVFLIGIILLQRDSSDGLSGLSGSSSSLGGIVTTKTADNILTKITKYLALAFVVNCLILTNLATQIGKKSSIIEKIERLKPESSKSAPIGE